MNKPQKAILFVIVLLMGVVAWFLSWELYSSFSLWQTISNASFQNYLFIGIAIFYMSCAAITFLKKTIPKINKDTKDTTGNPHVFSKDIDALKVDVAFLKERTQRITDKLDGLKAFSIFAKVEEHKVAEHS